MQTDKRWKNPKCSQATKEKRPSPVERLFSHIEMHIFMCWTSSFTSQSSSMSLRLRIVFEVQENSHQQQQQYALDEKVFAWLKHDKMHYQAFVKDCWDEQSLERNSFYHKHHCFSFCCCYLAYSTPYTHQYVPCLVFFALHSNKKSIPPPTLFWPIFCVYKIFSIRPILVSSSLKFLCSQQTHTHVS